MVKIGSLNYGRNKLYFMIQGVKQELQFWEVFVKTPRFLNDWCSNEKTSELDQDVADFILNNCPEGGHILDCGSGAVSVLKGLHKTANIVTTDLLADDYVKIFDYPKHGIRPTIAIGAEEVESILPVYGNFDIVHMRNALDHTQDPVKAYNSMLACVKPGGYLIIQGFENEGTFEKWQGMHQWDIEIPKYGAIAWTSKTILMLVDKTGDWRVLGTDPVFHKQIKLDTGKDWFVWIVKK